MDSKFFHLAYNINEDDWITTVVKDYQENNLLCLGEKDHLQWLGTNLAQVLADKETEVSPIYGKLCSNFENFCYQLSHSTPWGFKMGRNLNAVRDVIRGETSPKNKFFIWHDAHFLYLEDYSTFKAIVEIFLEVGEECKNEGINLKIALLFNHNEKISVRKLIKNKEKYPILITKVIQENLI